MEDTPVDPLSLPSSVSISLLSSFTTFLTVAIHSLLYQRNLYPRTTFLTARAYNLPVQQSRHPGVCNWVNDAVSAVSAQLQRAAVQRIVFAVHAKGSFRVLERWVFDVSSFPEWGRDDSKGRDDAAGAAAGDATVAGDAFVDAEEADHGEIGDGSGDAGVNWADVHEALRGALRRLAYAAEMMPPLEAGCTFTLAVELREEADAPIGHPQDWIPSQPSHQPRAKEKPQRTEVSAKPRPRATPVRSVQAGPLFFECWIEHPREEARESPANSKNPEVSLS